MMSKGVHQALLCAGNGFAFLFPALAIPGFVFSLPWLAQLWAGYRYYL